MTSSESDLRIYLLGIAAGIDRSLLTEKHRLEAVRDRLEESMAHLASSMAELRKQLTSVSHAQAWAASYSYDGDKLSCPRCFIMNMEESGIDCVDVESISETDDVYQCPQCKMRYEIPA